MMNSTPKIRAFLWSASIGSSLFDLSRDDDDAASHDGASGEVAEFDTRLPHWFGPADDMPVEKLSVHGKPTANACTSAPLPHARPRIS